MPNPTRAQYHIDTALTNVSVAYTQEQTNFVADRVFPRVPSAKQSNKYFTYDQGDMMRNQAKKRAPATESVGMGWRQSTGSYFCEPWALHYDVPWEQEANSDAPLNPRVDAAAILTEQMLIAREVEFMSSFFSTSLWTGSTTGSDITPGNLWSTVAGTPIEDIRAQATSIARKCGRRPNTLLLGTDVFDSLIDHPDLVDRIKYTQAATGATVENAMAALLGVSRVLVAYATQNTGVEGGTDTMAFIADANDALLVYAAPAPGLRTISGGYTFVWTAAPEGTTPIGQGISTFEMEELRADRIEINAYWDHKLIAATAGCFFNEVTS